MRVLFSPLRAILFGGAIIFAIVLNIVFIGNGGAPEWIGVLSAVPLLAFAGLTLATGASHRRDEKARAR
ncbi:hypothetical protein SRABI76_02271 [Microbacterium oxydans]|uniref:hypothetical protein n=1 Tax=Microbacterium oxydans TaxID=82380 RepID=UPI001D9E4296|nr:hypothetical protein [Microbacterium oxydans]CAH0211319.1 hypothetical protein SRABI76_02271 [Microbacterium oxydans]